MKKRRLRTTYGIKEDFYSFIGEDFFPVPEKKEMVKKRNEEDRVRKTMQPNISRSKGSIVDRLA